ncbi:MAG: RDD family protein [Elusimicrobiota bacterium]|nr:RDD family protein [Elusimicrobiota bacterium]
MTELTEGEQNLNQAAPAAEQPQAVPEKCAGFWIRCLALTLDSIVLFIGGLLIGVVLQLLSAGTSMGALIGGAFGAAYIIWMHGTYGQTLGKMAFKIKVLQTTNEPITYGTAFVRWLGTFPSMILLGIGYLMVGFRSDKRGLHDLMAGTKVIYVGKPSMILAGFMAFLLFLLPVAGVIAALAIPKMAELANKAKEGATKGALASLRSSLQVYYGDAEGQFPADNLASLTVNAKYIPEIPVLKLPGTGHPDTAEVVVITESDGENLTVFRADTGKWLYMADKKSKDWGTLIIDCNHKDTKGKMWNEY